MSRWLMEAHNVLGRFDVIVLIDELDLSEARTSIRSLRGAWKPDGAALSVNDLPTTRAFLRARDLTHS